MKDTTIIFRTNSELKEDLTNIGANMRPRVKLGPLIEDIIEKYRDANKHLIAGEKSKAKK